MEIKFNIEDGREQNASEIEATGENDAALSSTDEPVTSEISEYEAIWDRVAQAALKRHEEMNAPGAIQDRTDTIQEVPDLVGPISLDDDVTVDWTEPLGWSLAKFAWKYGVKEFLRHPSQHAGQWCARMEKKFGPGIEPYLIGLFMDTLDEVEALCQEHSGEDAEDEGEAEEEAEA